MSKRKDEEILLEIFIRFLKETEGVTYDVTGQNVPNRTGKKNFDRLLRAQSVGSTMALEITLIADNESDFKPTLRDSVLDCLKETIQAGLADLPCAITIETPYSFYGSMKTLKREAKFAAAKMVNTAKTMCPGQETEVNSPIGSFKLKLLNEGTKGVDLYSFGQDIWFTPSVNVYNISSMLSRRLTSKNEQLNTDADRKVLLIGRIVGIGIIERGAISDALAAMREDFPNIDELYVCYGDADVVRYW